jgi:hypothetical protein
MGGKGEGVRDRLRGVWQCAWNRSQIIPGASAAVLAILFFLQPGFIRTLDFKLLEEHFRLRGGRAPVVLIRIVAIDDASLEKLGRWPWPRATLQPLARDPLVARPTLLPACLKLAVAYLWLEQFPEAVREYERILQLEPKNQDARGALTRLRSHQLR